jgi:CIC family chloride channel protein
MIHPSAFVLVGMGGFFAGVAKVPIASLILIAEMTGGYSLIVPLLIVSTISYLLLGEVSLYEKQVSARVDSPAHVGDFAINILEHIPVKHALPADRKVEMIPEEMRLDKVIDLVVRSDQIDFPVVDKEMRLTGILSLTDVKKVMLDEEMHLVMVARDIATDDVLTVTPEDSLHTALKKMTAAEVRELPVVSTEDPRRVISMVSRKDLIRVYHDENEKATRNRVADSFM